MKTISKEFATKISNTAVGVYDTKRYRYIDAGSGYYRISLELIGTTAALSWDNWQYLLVRA